MTLVIYILCSCSNNNCLNNRGRFLLSCGFSFKTVVVHKNKTTNVSSSHHPVTDKPLNTQFQLTCNIMQMLRAMLIESQSPKKEYNKPHKKPIREVQTDDTDNHRHLTPLLDELCSLQHHSRFPLLPLRPHKSRRSGSHNLSTRVIVQENPISRFPTARAQNILLLSVTHAGEKKADGNECESG